MKTNTVQCPACRRSQARRGPDAIYHCPNCHGQFDVTPDEGGDYSDRNPAARLEREDRRREEKLKRLGVRR